MKYLLGPVLIIFVLSGIIAQPTRSLSQAISKPTPTPAKKKVASQSTVLKKKPATTSPKSSPGKTATGHDNANPKKQTSASARTSKPKTSPSKQLNEKEEFDKASAIEVPVEKIAALKQFLDKFPASSRKNEALELVTVSRIQLGQDKLKAAETEDGIALLRSAVAEMPIPIRDELFNGSILKIPTELYWNGQRTDALEFAASIEDKIGGNAGQLLGLAGFYLGIESGSDAKRLAEKAVTLDPASSAGYQTLGLAARLNFDLDEAEKAYSKALELEPESSQSLRSLAEIKRGQGKADEAVALYRRILEKDTASVPAQTGLILSLFDAGKQADAEAELAKSLEQTPNNVILLAGAAYWYAAHNDADKAIEYSRSAIEKDPRYIWSHIALARGYLAKKQPAVAEEILLKARRFGNFPTLEYELASARLMSGFFRDAADELKKSFAVKDGMIHTRLGGRVDRDDSGFVDLLASERRASIFEPASADDAETASRLKSLLEFDQAVDAAEPNENAAGRAADVFVGGDDRMKLHRELYAASGLLSKRIALPKVLELTKSAIGNTDDALDVPDPGAAVMASELYDSRAIALARDELIKVPEVPKPTLLAILRGRIEEIAGWALYYQNEPAEATVRLRRAVSVMPAKSSWWRSSMWKLGAALQADGKDAAALDAYIKSYSIDKPDAAKYVTVEALYRKVNGNVDGLETKIGVNPQPVAIQSADTSATVSQKTEPVEPKPEPSSAPDPTVPAKSNETAALKAEPSATPTPAIDLQAAARPVPDPSSPAAAASAITVTPTPTPGASLTTGAETTPTPSPETTPIPAPETSSTPLALAKPRPNAEATPTQSPEATPTPVPETSSAPLALATPKPNAEAKPTQSPEATPTSVPETSSTLLTQATPATTLADPKQVTEPKTEPLPSSVNETTTLPNSDVKQTKVDPGPAKEGSMSDQSQKSNPTESKSNDSLVASSEAKVKPLFQPIIIVVPKPEIKKKQAEMGEKKSVDPSPKDNAAQTSDESLATGEKRLRIAAGKDGNVVPPLPCSIWVSREAISILNNVGSLGILVRLDGTGGPKSITPTSDSPDDVQIKLEPEIGGVKGQAFYVIRSVTTKTGEFKVRFVASCGSKEVTVKVR